MGTNLLVSVARGERIGEPVWLTRDQNVERCGSPARGSKEVFRSISVAQQNAGRLVDQCSHHPDLPWGRPARHVERDRNNGHPLWRQQRAHH